MIKISEELVKLAEENSTFVTGLIKENEALHLENTQLKMMAGAGGPEAMVILRPGEIDQIVADAVAAEKARAEAAEALADRLGEAVRDGLGMLEIFLMTQDSHPTEAVVAMLDMGPKVEAKLRAALAEWRAARKGEA